jgi:hypothetical protein
MLPVFGSSRVGLTINAGLTPCRTAEFAAFCWPGALCVDSEYFWM